MLNAHAPGNEPYEAANPVPDLTIIEKVNRAAIFFVSALRVLVLSVPILIKLIKEMFIGCEKKSVAGWTALITGGAHGIGRAIAKELSKEGCNIAIVDIDGNEARAAAKELEDEFHIKAFGYEVDVANYKLLPKLRNDIENDIGPVDILVNNAGLMPLLSLREGKEEDVERIVAMVRTFLGGMIERRRGHIVSMSSMSALYPLPGAIIYTGTKFAIAGYTRALEQEIRIEGNSEGINFTCVHPYFVASRKDLMDCLNLRIPAITTEETAKHTVDGVLRNAKVIVIPHYLGIILKIFRLLPFEVQNLIRDHIFTEDQVRMIKDPKNYVISKKYS